MVINVGSSPGDEWFTVSLDTKPSVFVCVCVCCFPNRLCFCLNCWKQTPDPDTHINTHTVSKSCSGSVLRLAFVSRPVGGRLVSLCRRGRKIDRRCSLFVHLH